MVELMRPKAEGGWKMTQQMAVPLPGFSTVEVWHHFERQIMVVCGNRISGGRIEHNISVYGERTSQGQLEPLRASDEDCDWALGECGAPSRSGMREASGLLYGDKCRMFTWDGGEAPAMFERIDDFAPGEKMGDAQPGPGELLVELGVDEKTKRLHAHITYPDGKKDCRSTDISQGVKQFDKAIEELYGVMASTGLIDREDADESIARAKSKYRAQYAPEAMN